MTTKKAPVKRRRRHRRSAASVQHRAPVHHAKRRRRTHYSRKPRTVLSEAFNKASAISTGSAIISGAVGFFAAYQLNKTMQTSPAIQRTLLGGALAFVTGAMFGMPNVASGIAGAVVLDLINTQQNKMSENANYLNANELKQLPQVLSEDFLSAPYLSAPYLSAPYLSEVEDVDYEEMED